MDKGVHHLVIGRWYSNIKQLPNIGLQLPWTYWRLAVCPAPTTVLYTTVKQMYCPMTLHWTYSKSHNLSRILYCCNVFCSTGRQYVVKSFGWFHYSTWKLVNMSETEAYLQFKAHFRETKKSFYKYRDHHYIRCLQRNSPAGRNHLTKIFVITER